MVRFVASVAPLALRAYRLLWIGQTVSVAGDALVQVALVFAVLHLGGTAGDIGDVVAVAMVARVGCILAGGVWADRLRRQFVMLGADAARAAVQGVLAVALITGHAHIWELGVGAALYGAAQAFFLPASAGVVPEIVPAEQVQPASALMSFPGSFAAVGGPAAAGLLIAASGPGVVYAIDSVTFIVSAVSLSMLRLPPRSLPARSSFRGDLAAGWRELASRRWYWLNLLVHAMWNLAIPAYYVLGPVIAAKSLGGASAWGAISASWAAGGIAGGIVALRARPRRPLVAGNLVLVLGALPLLALAVPARTWVIAAAAACGCGAMVFMNTVWTATMARLIPQEVRSRVSSYDWLISLVVMPAGFAAVGPLAGRAGDATALTAATFVLAVPCILVIGVPAIRAVRAGTSPPVAGDAPA